MSENESTNKEIITVEEKPAEQQVPVQTVVNEPVRRKKGRTGAIVALALGCSILGGIIGGGTVVLANRLIFRPQVPQFPQVMPQVQTERSGGDPFGSASGKNFQGGYWARPDMGNMNGASRKNRTNTQRWPSRGQQNSQRSGNGNRQKVPTEVPDSNTQESQDNTTTPSGQITPPDMNGETA